MAPTRLLRYDEPMDSAREAARRQPRVGLALSSGGARGSAHTGVLKVLEREGIEISAVSGSSIGSLIGASLAVGIPAEAMEREWLATDVGRLFRGFLPSFHPAGLSSGAQLRQMLSDLLGDEQIEDLPIPYAAVACDIDSGEPCVLREGSLLDAVRASTAIPGIFHPVRKGTRLLVDGGLINPVPIDVCRTLGADVVIAVDVTPRPVKTTSRVHEIWTRIGQHLHETLSQQTWLPNSLIELLDSAFRERPESARPLPGVYSILNQSISILLQEVLRQKLILYPPEVLIRPELSLSFLSYTQAAEGIDAGGAAAERALPEIRRRIEEAQAA
jgi:NTE family protein